MFECLSGLRGARPASVSSCAFVWSLKSSSFCFICDAKPVDCCATRVRTARWLRATAHCGRVGEAVGSCPIWLCMYSLSESERDGLALLRTDSDRQPQSLVSKLQATVSWIRQRANWRPCRPSWTWIPSRTTHHFLLILLIRSVSHSSHLSRWLKDSSCERSTSISAFSNRVRLYENIINVCLKLKFHGIRKLRNISRFVRNEQARNLNFLIENF